MVILFPKTENDANSVPLFQSRTPRLGKAVAVSVRDSVLDRV